MTRIFGNIVSLDMFVLWLLEFFLCFLVFYVLLLPGGFPASAPAGVFGLHLAAANHAIILALAVGLTSIAIGLYRPEICLQTRRLLFNSVVGGLTAFPVIFCVSVLTGIDPSFLLGSDALWPMKMLLTWIILVFGMRLVFRVLLRSGLLTRRVLIVGSPQQASRTEEAIRQIKKGFFEVVGIIPATEAVSITPARLRQQRVWAVIVTPDARGAVPIPPLLDTRRRRFRFYADVTFREMQLRRLDLDHLEADWLLFANGLMCGRLPAAIRRCGDIALALVLLVVALPVMLVTAIAIKFDRRGPVLYRQLRVGQHGRPFTLLKFRSMHVDAEAGGPTWAAPRDPRVTRVGAFIRRVRIDELPQLFNVLAGEMSFVGPRPERPHFVDQLAEVIPFYRDRNYVRPGITGWAQVNFPYGASIEDARQKLSYDLYYVKHRSLLLDILILFATVRVILFQEGSR
jgi:sugar transferase (PEP-CTERM system associated)